MNKDNHTSSENNEESGYDMDFLTILLESRVS